MIYKTGVLRKKEVYGINQWVTLEVSDEIQVAMDSFDIISHEVAGKESVVTSLLDGTHKINSKHYSGNAVDFRYIQNKGTKNESYYYTTDQANLIKTKIQKKLGDEYTVLLEGDHFHIQFNS